MYSMVIVAAGDAPRGAQEQRDPSHGARAVHTAAQVAGGDGHVAGGDAELDKERRELRARDLWTP